MKIIIHNDNIDTSFFDKDIKANIFANIDKSLDEIVKELEKFETLKAIFIKDNLSNNYLEFLGIRLAFHIKFSEKLRDLPIVIISELTLFTLNKLNELAKILFTDNIFLIKSDEIENFKTKKVKFNFSKFLESIEIKPPKFYLSHHSVTNEWAVDVWSRVLEIDNDLIKKNREKLEYMLYYKYLKAKFEKNDLNLIQNNYSQIYGKILLIDDKKEWGEIIKVYLKKFFQEVEFNFLGGFKNISFQEIEKLVKEKIKLFNPDTIILDLRLLNEESQKVKEISGYKILKTIKKLNPSIQIILFTASKDSLILNIFFNQITGYIQKDSPFEKYSAKNSFESFNETIIRALKKRYLKKIWQITEDIKSLSFKNPNFAKNIQSNSNLVFEILNSNMRNSFVYAVYQMIKILEEISYKLIYFDKQDNCYKFKKDNEKLDIEKNSLRLKVYEILKKLKIYDEEKRELICEIIEFRNRKVHGNKKQNSHCKEFIEKVSQKKLIEFYRVCYLILDNIKSN